MLSVLIRYSAVDSLSSPRHHFPEDMIKSIHLSVICGIFITRGDYVSMFLTTPPCPLTFPPPYYNITQATVKVWDYRIVKQRTRVTVLPGKFGDGMKPSLGEHHYTEQEVAEKPFDIVLEALLKVLARRKGGRESPAATSTISLSPASSGVNSSASSETDT